MGDNRLIDAVGACSAGLVGVWLDRTGMLGEPDTAPAPDPSGVPVALSEGAGDPEGAGPAEDALEVPRITDLAAVLQFLPSVR